LIHFYKRITVKNKGYENATNFIKVMQNKVI